MDTNALPALAPRTVGQKDELRLEGRDKGGWHQNWFALARSEEVGPEQVIGRDVLGGRILAWRAKAGKLGGCSPRGPDLRADPSGRKVARAKIPSGVLLWEYGPERSRPRPTSRSK